MPKICRPRRSSSLSARSSSDPGRLRGVQGASFLMSRLGQVTKFGEDFLRQGRNRGPSLLGITARGSLDVRRIELLSETTS